MAGKYYPLAVYSISDPVVTLEEQAPKLGADFLV